MRSPFWLTRNEVNNWVRENVDASGASGWELHAAIDKLLTQQSEILVQNERILDRLSILEQEMKVAITDMASALAAIQNETNMLAAIQASENALKGAAATIAAEIAALQAQVAAGSPPDFTALNAAVTANDAAIAGVSAALQASPAATGTTGP